MPKTPSFLKFGFFLALLSACAPAGGSNVPASWLAEGALSGDDARAEERLAEDMDTILISQARAVQSPEIRGTAGNWRLDTVTTELGISAKGLLGLLVGKGTSAVQVDWSDTPGSGALSRGSHEITVSGLGPDARVTLERKMRALARALRESGEIRDEAELMKTLSMNSERFLRLAQTLTQVSPGIWYPERCTYDILVDVGGKLVGGIDAQVRVRLEWKRGLPEDKDPGTEPDAKLEEFVRMVAEDLTVIAESSELSREGYVPATVAIGVGLSAGGDVYFVKGNYAALGTIHFVRHREMRSPVVTSGGEYSIGEMIGKKPQDPLGYLFGKLNRKKFREALARSAKVSGFFAKAAAKTKPVGKWKVREITTAFDFSWSGFLGLPFYKGLASTRIGYRNEKL